MKRNVLANTGFRPGRSRSTRQYSLIPLERFGGLKVFDLNSYALLGDIKSDPAAFGFTNVNDPVWTGNSPAPLGEAGLDDPSRPETISVLG